MEQEKTSLVGQADELMSSMQNVEAEKATLEQTITYWKQRVTSLTQKYNQEKADDATKAQYAISQNLSSPRIVVTRSISVISLSPNKKIQ